MNYGKKVQVNYALEDMQKQRELAEGESKVKIQKKIDQYFFGNPGRRKTRRERKKERRKERQRMREEDY